MLDSPGASFLLTICLGFYLLYKTSLFYNVPFVQVKDKADLLESFLGALYIDKDLQYCEVFAQVYLP
jgi:hypothetical protein